MHFHGIRQNWTDSQDGVPSITQCPVAPGDSITYTWRAVEYGTGWYHSHFYVQAWDGVFGGILINGPATANYDVDLGHLFLNDWYHKTADVLVLEAATGGPPSAATGLINGTNAYNETLGSVFETTFEPGVKYRLRLVNAAADSHFRFMIDDHELEVIATDFVPIVPYTTDQISIGMGQRYDLIVTAKDNATAGNFWMRAYPQSACTEADYDVVKGIIRYDSTSTEDPTTSGYAYADSCADEFASSLVPYYAMNATASYVYKDDETVALQVNDNALLWVMNKTSFNSAWENPTLLQIANGDTTFSASMNVIELPDADAFTILVVHSPFSQDHPIHLHGHDFFVLGKGYGGFDATSDADALTFVNPPRRDVAMMPASGYLVIGFYTDNPGVSSPHI